MLIVAAPAQATERLLGAWCDDTGYRIDLQSDKITFHDRQMERSPARHGSDLRQGVAVYRQDFRPAHART